MLLRSIGPWATVVGLVCALATPAAVAAQSRTARRSETSHASAPTDRAVQVHLRAVAQSRRISRLLDEARLGRDRLRVRCLDGVLSRTNSTLRQVDRRAERLRRAIAAEDTAGRNHELSVLTVLDASLLERNAEARVCIGETAVISRRTVVTVTIDPSVPNRDPTRLRDRRVGLPWLAPPASPTL